MDNVIIVENGEPMTTSLKIAEVFGKSHGKVIRDIRNLLEKLESNTLYLAVPDLASLKFEQKTYLDKQGKERLMFNLNKNAMVLTVMKYTTKEALKFQVNYIEQFDAMQKQLEQQSQQDFFQVETPDQQTKRITAEAYKMQCENGRMKEFRLAMKQADKLERNDLAELLLEKEVETFIGQPIKQAVPIDHKSQFHLTASKIAERFGVSATRVGSVAKLLGMHEGVDRIKVDERWLYTERAVSKMRARLEA